MNFQARLTNIKHLQTHAIARTPDIHVLLLVADISWLNQTNSMRRLPSFSRICLQARAATRIYNGS